MRMRQWLVLAVLLLACKKDEPKSTRWDDAAAAIASAAPASSTPRLATGSFNKFFPKDGDGGYSRVFTADKEGFAEAKLMKDGNEAAVISISDTNDNALAKTKFAASKEKLGDYPVATLGKNQTMVLVKDRFQVKVSSQTLDHDARKAILQTFDLKGLEP